MQCVVDSGAEGYDQVPITMSKFFFFLFKVKRVRYVHDVCDYVLGV